MPDRLEGFRAPLNRGTLSTVAVVFVLDALGAGEFGIESLAVMLVATVALGYGAAILALGPYLLVPRTVRPGGRAVAAAVPVILISVPLLARGASGAWISRQWFATPLLLIAVVGLCWFDWRVVRVLASLSGKRSLWTISAFLAAATSALIVERRVFVGLYPALHLLVVVQAAFLLAQAGARLPGGGVTRPRLGLGLQVAALIAVAAVLLGCIPGTDPDRRDLVLRRAPILSRILPLVPGVRLDRGGEAGEDRIAAYLPDGRATAGETAWLDRTFPWRREGNVLLVTIDTLRADHCGFAGYSRPTTPVLDALATRSMVFDRAYATYPSTLLSTASLFSGRFPTATSASDEFRGSKERELPLQRLLSAAGRSTHARTAIPPVRRVDMHYLEGEWTSSVNGPDEGVTDGAAIVDQAIDLLASADLDQPWFLWVHLFEPHWPYAARDEAAFGRSEVDLYDGEVAFADRQLGRLLAELERSGRSQDTLVIVHSDHGQEFKEHGGSGHGSSLFEEQLRVPLVIHAAGLTACRVEEEVGLVDVLPTIGHFLGIEDPVRRNGRSLWPLALDEAAGDVPARAVFFQLREGAFGHGELDGVRLGRFKLIENLRTGDLGLYDLERDPGELANRAAADPKAVQSMLPWLRAAQEATRRVAVSVDGSPVKDARPRVRDAARHLANGRRADGVATIAALLEDGLGDESRLVRVGRLIQHHALREVVEAFARESAPSAVGRRALARALSAFDDAGTLEMLRGLARDPDARVRMGARLSQALRGLDIGVLPRLDEVHGEDIESLLILRALIEPEGESRFVSQCLGTGVGDARAQMKALRAATRRGHRWLSPDLYLRSGVGGLPDVAFRRAVNELRFALDDEAAMPLLRWSLLRGKAADRERARQRLEELGHGMRIPDLKRHGEIVLKEMNDVVAKVVDAVAAKSVLIDQIEKEVTSRRFDWGMAYEFLTISTLNGVEADDVRRLESWRRSVGGDGTATDAYLKRWVDVLESCRAGSPTVRLELERTEVNPTGETARILIRAVCDPSGGGMAPVGFNQTGGAIGQIFDERGVVPESTTVLQFGIEGVLPGESRLLLAIVPIDPDRKGAVSLKIVPVYRGAIVGKMLVASIRGG